MRARPSPKMACHSRMGRPLKSAMMASTRGPIVFADFSASTVISKLLAEAVRTREVGHLVAELLAHRRRDARPPPRLRSLSGRAGPVSCKRARDGLGFVEQVVEIFVVDCRLRRVRLRDSTSSGSPRAERADARRHGPIVVDRRLLRRPCRIRANGRMPSRGNHFSMYI